MKIDALSTNWAWFGDTLAAGPNGTHLLYAQEAPGLGDQAEPIRSAVAAVPDMLAALKLVVDKFHGKSNCYSIGQDRALSEAIAAIAKAEAGK